MQRAGLLAPFRSMGCREKHCGGNPQALEIPGSGVYISEEVLDAYVSGLVS